MGPISICLLFGGQFPITFKLKYLLYKKVQNVEVQVFSPLIKNLQFLSDFAQTFRDGPTNGLVKP